MEAGEDHDAASNFSILMWGYLPASSPQRAPLVNPTKVSSSGDGWKAVCSGGCGFAVAISESGKLHTWGSTDDAGQCYHIAGKQQDQPEPFPFQTDSKIVHAAAGWAHCACSTEIGEVYTWGWKECVPTEKIPVDQGGNHNSDNLEGDNGEFSPSTSPDASRRPRTGTGILRGKPTTPATHVEKSRASFAGGSRLQIKPPSKLSADKVQDENTKKRRMNVEEAASPETPGAAADDNVMLPPCLVLLPSGIKIIKVAAGGRHTLALTDAGKVWGWGYGGEGQLGLGSRMRSVSSPQPVACFQNVPHRVGKGNRMNEVTEQATKVPGNHIIAIACGGRHSAALTDGGAVLAFGWGAYGQCGQGNTEDELSPAYVSALGGLRITGIAAGLWHTLCITDTGSVYSFGGNQFGQLGVAGEQAETLPRLVDTPVLENEAAISVSAGARHSAICTESRKVFCWGWNKYGQLGLGDNVDRDTPNEVILNYKAQNIACGWWHTLALVYSP